MASRVPDLLKMTLTAQIHEVRAYISSAFSPKIVDEAMDNAVRQAEAMLPAQIEQEVNAAVREVVAKMVRDAFSNLRWDRELRAKMREVIVESLRNADKDDPPHA